MKTLISLFLISFVAFCTISCNDDDKDTPDLANRYGAYEKPHFAFEYASDTIRIGMKPYYEKKIAVTEFKAMFNAMATEKMGAYFMEQLRTLPHVREVRGQGLLVGVEFDDTISGVDVKHGCLERKLLITAIGAHIIRMVPPLILNQDDCDKAVTIIRETVESLSTKEA